MTTPPRFRALLVVVLALAAALLAGAGVAGFLYAGRDSRPAEALGAAPTTPPDYNRQACHLLSANEGDQSATLKAEMMVPVATAATQASNVSIAAAGREIAAIFADGDAEPGDESLRAREWSRELAAACAAKYGDGPW